MSSRPPGLTVPGGVTGSGGGAPPAGDARAERALAELCVTCLVRAGRPRPTVLKAVVCGSCWAAHGGMPDADEIGPAPELTAPTRAPADQGHWVRALSRQDWVRDIRVDGRRNLRALARLLALHADWDTLETRPTWATLVRRSGLHERTVARWLQELRVRGWLVLLEHGSTPDTRPMTLAHLTGNRAALYGLRIPLAPEEALAPAGGQRRDDVVGDRSVSPSCSFRSSYLKNSPGTSRARQPVDNPPQSASDLHKQQPSALRAGSDRRSVHDFSILVPAGGFEMLVAAQWLRRRLPVFGRCSAKLVRHLCKPYWRAGWCNRDIVHALDHRPSVFGQHSGLLISPEHPACPAQFIRSRLRAWRDPKGTIVPGYWSSHVTDAAAARDTRRRVAERHGAAGARLLRAGERALTAERITEHGRQARGALPPLAGHPRSGAGADRDRLRAYLLAKARAEIGVATERTRHTTGGGGRQEHPGGPLSHPAPAGGDVVQRALDAARRAGHGAAPRRRRRGTSW